MFYRELDEGEHLHLERLHIGAPVSLQDFDVTQDRLVTRAVGVLYRDIFILFRYKPQAALVSWDDTSETVSSDAKERLFIYCYLYPRHITSVAPTRNGNAIS
jgi:hypothetical protein